MAAVRRSTSSVVFALLWAIIGSALIGGTVLVIVLILDGTAFGIYESPWLALFAPFAFAAPSLLVVIPCTLLFGVPSIMVIDRLRMSKWPALGVCLAGAILTQIAAVRLTFWDEYAKIGDYWFTAPFALGAALILWWRLTRAR
ncbi:MAG: hypothetical protein ACKO01_07620 [Erythrobacter sp.]